MIEVEWVQKDGISIATVAGRIDGRNADKFQRTIESGIDSETHALILDFAQVFFLSSAGIRASLKIAKNFNELDKQFAICTIPGQVGDVIEISGLARIIPVYNSQAAAINALKNS